MKHPDSNLRPNIATYLGLLLVSLALFLGTAGCGGGGGGGTGTQTANTGGTGTAAGTAAGTTTGTTAGSGTSGGTSGTTTTGGSGGSGGTFNSSSPPPPPDLVLPRAVSTSEFVPNKVLVKVKPAVRGRGGQVMRDLSDAASTKGLRIQRKRRFERLRTEEVQIESGQSVEEAIDLLSQLPEVEYAEPDFILRKTETIPNDSFFGDMWAHRNTGQSGGTVGADIQTTFAWDIQTGDSNVIISVIDTGVDYNHPDIAANMWRNPGEDGGVTGVDDDNNGYVDDIFGINAITGSGDPMDDEGHGTHVAGTAAATGNNNTGVVGVAYNTRIMALKFLNSSGSGTTSDAIECLEYAIEQGAHVSNASWGGPGFSTSLFNTLQIAGNNNHVLVAAAGNSAINVDGGGLFSQHYPSGYALDNIISVGASTRFEQIASFSNFGTTSVDLFAPGQSILSTLPNSNYAFFSGTSMASPHVAGVAALLFSDLGPSTPYGTITDRILDNVETFPAYQNRCLSEGRLNAHYALDPSAAPTPTTTPTPEPTVIPTPEPVADAISLAAGWNLFSFPSGEITEISLPQGVQNTFWVWNPSSQSYQSISPTVSSLNAGAGTGRGFWVFADSATTLSYSGIPAETKTLVLEPGWNLVGLPRQNTVNTNQLTLTNLANSQEQFLSDAACEEIPASPPCLVFQYLFFWTGSYVNLNAGQASTTLATKRAYWIHSWTRSELNFFPISIE